MKEINDGGPAFPGTHYAQGISPSGHSDGMSKRDYFAAKAMAACIGNTSGNFGVSYEVNNKNLAMAAYAIADAMIAEGSK